MPDLRVACRGLRDYGSIVLRGWAVVTLTAANVGLIARWQWGPALRAILGPPQD